MGNPAVQDVDAVYTVPHGGSAVVQLGQHASADIAAGNQFFRLGSRYSGNEALSLLEILVNALDIRQESQLLRLHRPGNGTGGIIRIDIVSPETVVQAYGGYDRKEIFLQ